MTKYIEDPEYLETILKKHKCPYCECSLHQPYPSKRHCQRCDFILYGDPKAVAFKIDEETFDYTYNIDQCPECESKTLFYEQKEKELVCLDCGLVLTSLHRYVGYHKINYPFGLHLDSNFFL